MKILGICGSLQQRSSNAALIELAVKHAPHGVRVEASDLLRALPHFDSDLDTADAPPAVGALRRAVSEADALLIACPEYGHSLPGALKNAIDWLIGSGELECKLVAITASVPGPPERGQRGLDALAGTLAAVSAEIVGGQPLVRGPDFERSVVELLEALVARARKRAHSVEDE